MKRKRQMVKNLAAKNLSNPRYKKRVVSQKTKYNRKNMKNESD